MIRFAGRWMFAVMALLVGVTVAHAQEYSRPPAFTQQELDRMLAPIALYPDALLSQVLMAATYPRDVDEAAQWSRRNGDLNGDRAVRAVERYDWDPSVKSLVAFPQILDMMSEKMDWTQDVGDAFLDQQAQVMDTVQYLRRQAYAEGNLRSSDQLRVEAREGSFTIDFMSADYACLPYYDPLVVYGRWWWPARPVYWAPWHGYYARPGYAGYVWGPPVAVGRGFFYSRPDWHARRIEIVNVNNYYYRAPTHYRTAPLDTPHVWQRDNRDRRVYVQREGVRERDGRVPMTFVPQPQARVVAAPPAQSSGAAQVATTPAPNAEPRRMENRGFENRYERHERGDGRFEGNRTPPASTVPAPQVAQPAPAATQVAVPQIAHQPQPQSAPAQTAGAPAQTAEPRRFGDRERGFDNRGFENRNERRERTEGRFEGTRVPQVAAAPAPQVTPTAPAPLPPIAQPVRVQQMPVPTPPPPAVANRSAPQAAVAAAPRPQENNNGRRDGHRDGNHGGR